MHHFEWLVPQNLEAALILWLHKLYQIKNKEINLKEFHIYIEDQNNCLRWETFTAAGELVENRTLIVRRVRQSTHPPGNFIVLQINDACCSIFLIDGLYIM